jgi:hypothetical protein
LKLLAAAAIFFASIAAAQSPSIQFRDGAFRVTGWAAQGDLASVFAVYAGSGDVQPMLGKYSIEGGSLVFRPQFPLSAGVRYLATFHPPGATPIETAVEGPKKETTPSTRIERVYPTADVLPSNNLKLYIFFSAPMSRGDAWRHVHLLDEHGKAVSMPFLELNQELWDPDFRRFTLLFDPGRIKRGLVPNNEVGPPIEAGMKYTLVIDDDWTDARGVPLTQGYRKPFTGAEADRTPPDTARWKLTPPKAGTMDTLVVDFDEPMDYALLQRLINVVAGTQTLEGRIEVTGGETEWRFTPDLAWPRGAYQLVVDTTLEDLAGNHIGRAFDVDTFEKISEKITRRTVSVPFQAK